MPVSRCVNTLFVVFITLFVACSVQAEEKGSTYYDLGVFSYESGDYETAEKNLKKALTLSPNHPPYHQYLGKVYLKMKRYDVAMKHLKQAWSGDPELPGLRYDLAYGHFQLEEYTKAADLFKQLTEENPTHVLAHYYAGVSLYNEKQYQIALDYFLAAARMSPTIRVNGRYYAGLCYLKTGDKERALRELAYVRDNTDSESLKENSSQWLESIQNQEKALKPYILYAKIGYQYDDNVRYEPLDEDIFSDKADYLTSLDFVGRYNFVNKPDLKCIAGYYHYQTLHNQLDEYDLAESVPNINVKYLMAPYTFGLNYLYYYYWVDYERYLRRHRLVPEVAWDINDQFSAHLKYSYYDNEHFQDNRYDGDNHEISLLFDYRRLAYETEVNLIGETGYEDNHATHPDEDYSRIKVRGSVYFMGPWQLRFKLTARYEDKTYDNTDSFFNVKREDERYEGAILIAHRFFYDFLNIQTKYTYTKNDSNINFFEYEKNVIGLYLTVTY